jgi:hypothetical protein
MGKKSRTAGNTKKRQRTCDKLAELSAIDEFVKQGNYSRKKMKARRLERDSNTVFGAGGEQSGGLRDSVLADLALESKADGRSNLAGSSLVHKDEWSDNELFIMLGRKDLVVNSEEEIPYTTRYTHHKAQYFPNTTMRQNGSNSFNPF